MAAGKWTPETPWFKSNKQTQANWPTYVCKNPNCKSYGKSHPNCKCGAPSFAAQSKSLEYSTGGEVRFCSGGGHHEAGCEYFSEGGSVYHPAPLPGGSADNPSSTLGHAAVEHGLVGLLNGSVGDPYLSDPPKAARIIDDAKRQHRFNGSGPSMDGLEDQAPQRTAGTRWGDHIYSGDHTKAADELHDQPLVGSVGKTTLQPILERLSGPMLEKDTNPEAFRGAVDYLGKSAQGYKRLQGEMGSIMGPHKLATHFQAMSRESDRSELKEHLEELRANPAKLLGVAGSLGHYLPEHAGQLGYTAATAMNYLDSIKPKQPQAHPLDAPSTPSPVEVDAYERQLDIANQPLLVLNHIKDGTISPQDMTTIKTIYPGLHDSIVKEVGDALIEAKARGEEIPYKHRMGLSMVLGQPLDSTMTAQSMMAIIGANGDSQVPSQQTSQHGPTAQTQKTIEKADQIYQTQEQKRQLGKD